MTTRDELRACNERFSAALAANDSEAIAAAYTDDDPPARLQHAGTRRQHARDPVDVRGECRLRRAALGCADLARAQVLEAEQLVGVAVLLVVVDEPGIRRRRDDGVERTRQVELT